MKKIFLLLFGCTLSIATIAQQTFTTSGTYTVPSGVTSVMVEVIGAGGKGGSNGAGGGGGGGYASGVYTVTPGSTHAVIVGQAASGSGTSSVSSLGISATKGANGTSLKNPQIVGGGGNGGNGIGGQINRTGGNGGGGYYTYFGGGGGGAAGSTGDGGDGGNTIAWTGICQTPGGVGGLSGGAPGGAGGKGAGFTDVSCNVPDPAAPGGNYGAGGGGANGNGGPAALGANGFVKISICAPVGPPSGSNLQTFCGPATVADLVAQGTGIEWYLTPTGGTPLASNDVLTDNTLYYAEQTPGPCETPTRLEVTVNIIPTFGAPSGDNIQTFCGSATIADLVAQGTSIQWYSTPTGGTPLANNDVLIDNTSYYAQQPQASCETPARLEVTVNIITIDISTSLTGTTITSNETGATYEWLDCDANQIIPNATDQSYTPTSTGNYAVIITNGACSDTSECVKVNFVGLLEQQKSSDIKIYPNPATEELTIQITNLIDENNFTIIDQNGKIVKHGELKIGETNINVNELMNGLYIIKIGEKETQTFKIIKK